MTTLMSISAAGAVTIPGTLAAGATTITGALSATGALTAGSAATGGIHSLDGTNVNGTYLGIKNNGTVFSYFGSWLRLMGSGAVGDTVVYTEGAKLGMVVAGTVRGEFSSTGLSVTGALSVTGDITMSAGGRLVQTAGGIVYVGGGNAAQAISQASIGALSTTLYIGNQSITTISDARLKENIVPTTRNALDLLNQWEIVDHTWNDPSDQCENNRNMRGVWTGAIAQQVQPITPWLVNKPLTDVDENGEINTWSVDYGYAVPLLVKAIQELAADFQAYKSSHP